MSRQVYYFSYIVFLFATALLIFISCTKEQATPAATVCDVRGTYSGTNLSSTGASTTLTYKLQDNNFAVGSVTPSGAGVTFGGYRNTCDSVILSVYYSGNSSYYLLQGKLLNNRTTIAGTFKNLTTPTDFGTFSISK